MRKNKSVTKETRGEEVNNVYKLIERINLTQKVRMSINFPEWSATHVRVDVKNDNSKYRFDGRIIYLAAAMSSDLALDTS